MRGTITTFWQLARCRRPAGRRGHVWRPGQRTPAPVRLESPARTRRNVGVPGRGVARLEWLPHRSPNRPWRARWCRDVRRILPIRDIDR